MRHLPTWMRVAMLATAVMNLIGGVAFVPSARGMRALGGLPEAAHPFYPATIGAFILIFGVAYLWAAVTGKADRMFVAVAAAGKLAFFGLMVRYWLGGVLSATAVVTGLGDLVFGMLFVGWLACTYLQRIDDGGTPKRAPDAPPN